MTARILELRTRQTCACCGFKFRPLSPAHQFCRECYLWSLAWAGIEGTRKALAQLREQGR